MDLKEEIYRVYADCHMKDFEAALPLRDLEWLGPPSDLDEAHSAFLNACQHYNNFDCDNVFLILKKICEGYKVKVSPAREGSPALYLYCHNEENAQEIFQKIKKDKSLYIDDLNMRKDNIIHMWWD